MRCLELSHYPQRRVLYSQGSGSKPVDMMSPRGHLTIPGDIFEVTAGEGAIGMEGAEVRHAANSYNAQDSSPQQRSIRLTMSVVMRLRNLALR